MRRPAMLVLCCGLAIGAAGCGGSSSATDVVPKTLPALTAPDQSGIPGSAAGQSNGAPTTDTTPTTDTNATGGGSTPQQSGGDSAPQTGGGTSTPSTGGQDSSGSGQPSTGGGSAPSSGDSGTKTTSTTGGAGAGDFTEFCKQSPGACPGN